MTKKLNVECYEITARFLIRKDYWKADNPKESIAKLMKDRIQSGVETPIEKEGFEVKVK